MPMTMSFLGPRLVGTYYCVPRIPHKIYCLETVGLIIIHKKLENSCLTACMCEMLTPHAACSTRCSSPQWTLDLKSPICPPLQPAVSLLYSSVHIMVHICDSTFCSQVFYLCRVRSCAAHTYYSFLLCCRSEQCILGQEGASANHWCEREAGSVSDWPDDLCHTLEECLSCLDRSNMCMCCVWVFFCTCKMCTYSHLTFISVP